MIINNIPVQLYTVPIKVVERPDIHCSFDIMDRCTDSYSNESERKACMEGVRDAHLLKNQHIKYDRKEQEAYESGKFTTVQDCTSLPVQHVIH